MSGAAIGSVRGGRRARRGFTVTELLVVIAIIALVLSVAVPSLNAMLRDSSASLADQTLRTAVLSARDAAVHSTGQADGAVVFLFEPGGAVRAVPAIWVGRVLDRRDASENLETRVPTGLPPNFQHLAQPNAVERDVFAPLPGAEAIVFPDWWSVRGWAPAGAITGEWYDSEGYGGEGNPTSLPAVKQRGQWVFPETGFYGRAYFASTEGTQDFPGDSNPADRRSTPRQSFMVRFEAGTGAIKQGGEPAIFVDPNQELDRDDDDVADLLFRGVSDKEKQDDLYQQGWRRVDRMESVAAWAKRMVRERDFNRDGRPDQDNDVLSKLPWIGNESHDTVLVRSVTRLALYDERVLAEALGGRVNRATRSAYLPWSESSPKIAYDPAAFESGLTDPMGRSEMITRRISGDTDSQLSDLPQFTPDDRPFARVFVVQSYTGELVEVVQ